MALKKDIETEINGFLKALHSNEIPVAKAILFGSMATGNPTSNSDIDLAIWSPAFSDFFYENIHKTLTSRRPFKRIELHPFSMNDNRHNNPFIDVIEKSGIPISMSAVLSNEGFKLP